jgi:tetratricopeptide (TPR) repeat protein
MIPNLKLKSISTLPPGGLQETSLVRSYSEALKLHGRATMTKVRLLLAGSVGALVLALPAHACEKHNPAKQTQTELKQFGKVHHMTPRSATVDEAPLWPGTDAVSYPVTTKSPQAQQYFNQGLMLAYGFNHAEARRSFQAAQRLDPTCAMCFWGEALVLGPNINAPMDPDTNGAAHAAITHALSLMQGASARERSLISALAKRYTNKPGVERSVLDASYADAMVAVAARFPVDAEVATLTAEALMDLTPWDYWEAGGGEPKGRTSDILKLLEGVLARNPDHPGAIHLYIHAVEASDRPERAEAYADRLASQKLGAGHLVHMPSHIYYRVGRYKDSLEVNKRAVAADEVFLKSGTGSGIYAGGYYPHNIHFLMVSAQMAGDGPTAITAAEKLEAAISDEVARTYPWVQPIKASPLFAHAQFSEPERILSLPRPTGSFPYVEALWHYTRGVAFAALKDRAAAQGEAQAIADILVSTDWSSLVSGGLPAPDVLALAREVVLGRIAQAENNFDEAVAAFERAASIEDRLPYMEPPFWYYPVRQSLGAAYLQAGDAAKAEHAFRTSLKAAPHNGWALFGLYEVFGRKGESSEREDIARRLDRSWAGERSLLYLPRL